MLRLRQQEEERRAREEELRKQQELELQRRREQEEKLRMEQMAVLNVRKVIQKMRTAEEETFQEINTELEQVLQSELPKTGAQAGQLKVEAGQQAEMAKQRIEQMKEQKRLAEERQKELERQRLEQEEQRKKFMVDLEALVESLEKSASHLQELASPAFAAATATAQTVAEAEAVVRGEAGAAAKAAGKACTDLMIANRSAVEALRQNPETKATMIEMQSRVHKGLEKVVTVSISVTAAHDTMKRKELALQRLEKRNAVFTKYSKAQAGMLSRKEIPLYAQGEFGFSLLPEAADRIVARLAGEGGSVPKENFQQLKIAVAVAREEEASRQRAREAEERRKRLEEQKAALKADFDKVSAHLDDTESDVAKAEEKCNALVAELDNNHNGEKEAAEPTEALEEAQKAIEAAKEEVEDQRKRLAELSGEAEEALKPTAEEAARPLAAKVGSFEARLERALAGLKRVRAHWARKALAGLEALRVQAAQLMKEHIGAKSISKEDLFKAADKNEDGAIDKPEFVSFFEALEDCKIEAEQLGRLFAYLCSGPSLSQDAFLRLAAVCYRVVKESPMTTQASVSRESKTVRRLAENEVVEVYEGPIKDDKGITRVKCCAVKDGNVGWVTVEGNSNNVFLEAGGGEYQATCATTLTASVEVSSDVVGDLKAGDKVDVFEWDKKDESTGAIRMRVSVQGQASSGWATRVLADGFQVLKPTA